MRHETSKPPLAVAGNMARNLTSVRHERYDPFMGPFAAYAALPDQRERDPRPLFAGGGLYCYTSGVVAPRDRAILFCFVQNRAISMLVVEQVV